MAGPGSGGPNSSDSAGTHTHPKRMADQGHTLAAPLLAGSGSNGVSGNGFGANGGGQQQLARAAVELSNRFDSLVKVTELQEQLVSQEAAKLAELYGTCDVLKLQLLERTEALEAAQSRLELLEGAAADYRRALDAKTGRIESLQALLKAKDEKLAATTQAHNGLRVELDALTRVNAALEAQLAGLEPDATSISLEHGNRAGGAAAATGEGEAEEAGEGRGKRRMPGNAAEQPAAGKRQRRGADAQLTTPPAEERGARRSVAAAQPAEERGARRGTAAAQPAGGAAGKAETRSNGDAARKGETKVNGGAAAMGGRRGGAAVKQEVAAPSPRSEVPTTRSRAPQQPAAKPGAAKPAPAAAAPAPKAASGKPPAAAAAQPKAVATRGKQEPPPEPSGRRGGSGAGSAGRGEAKGADKKPVKEANAASEVDKKQGGAAPAKEGRAEGKAAEPAAAGARRGGRKAGGGIGRSAGGDDTWWDLDEIAPGNIVVIRCSRSDNYSLRLPSRRGHIWICEVTKFKNNYLYGRWYHNGVRDLTKKLKRGPEHKTPVRIQGAQDILHIYLPDDAFTLSEDEIQELDTEFQESFKIELDW